MRTKLGYYLSEPLKSQNKVSTHTPNQSPSTFTKGPLGFHGQIMVKNFTDSIILCKQTLLTVHAHYVIEHKALSLLLL